jgi:zinc transporter 1/2/3
VEPNPDFKEIKFGQHKLKKNTQQFNSIMASKNGPKILLGTLALHSLLESLLVGLLLNYLDVVKMTIAILIHKSISSISLVGSLHRCGVFKRAKFYLLLFSLTSPLGCIIGIILSSESIFLEVIFLSFCSGSFIYIACTEIVTVEFSKKGH